MGRAGEIGEAEQTSDGGPSRREDCGFGRAALTRETMLELAFQAVRVDPPGASASERQALARLRGELLSAAIEQFVGHADGLERTTGSMDVARLGKADDGNWSIVHLDAQGRPARIDRLSDERAAVRTLILASRARARTPS